MFTPTAGAVHSFFLISNEAILLLSGVVPLLACPGLDRIVSAELSFADLARARTPRPAETSHVHGANAADAFAKMNHFLQGGSLRTRSCDQWNTTELDELARALHGLRDPALDAEYKQRGDRRALHFDGFEHKERLWEAEAGRLEPGTQDFAAARDGKCAEIVMWWIHHLAEGQRAQIAAMPDFELPLMPADLAPEELRSAEYKQQTGCSACHMPIDAEKAPAEQEAETRDDPPKCLGSSECPVWPREFSAPFALHATFPPIAHANSTFYYKFTADGTTQATLVDYETRCFPFVNAGALFSGAPCKLLFVPSGIYLLDYGKVRSPTFLDLRSPSLTFARPL